MDDRAGPALAPGVRVVRLGNHLLQVGLEHGRAVRLPRTPTNDRALRALATGEALPPDATGLLEELVERGLAVTVPAPGATVAVLGDPPADPAPLLAAAGLGCTTSLSGADLVLLASAGELDRDLVAPLARTGQAHLPVRLVDGLAIVGPFSVPGRSACLCCVDLHRAAEDTAHLLLVDRYVRAAGGPTDLVLGNLALAWAVRDLATFAAGGCPSSWSRTLRIDPTRGEVTARPWWRHPECGCTWGEAPSATMEA